MLACIRLRFTDRRVDVSCPFYDTQERIVHPCGSSAFGVFEVTNDISHITKAAFLQPGAKTPAYTRFSTVTYGVSPCN